MNFIYDLSKYKGAKADWRNPYSIAIIAYYLAMAFVALLIPDDILKESLRAKQFSDLMACIVPQIDRITELGIKPDVNRFYFSLLWAGNPLLFTLCTLGILSGRLHDYPMWSIPFFKALPFFLFAIFLAVWTQYLWNVDPNLRLSKAFFSTNLGRGFFGQIVFNTGASFAIVAPIVWLVGWLTGYIPRNIERQRNGR